MALFQRMIAGGAASAVLLILGTTPALAAKKTNPVPPRAVAAPVQVTRPAAALPPMVLQVAPLKLNPSLQPNVMIVGQHLTAATHVLVGGHPATTVQAPDAYHLLVKLPDDLAQGTYTVMVSNEAGTVTADDPLVIDQSGTGPSNLTLIMGGGLLLLLVLVMRLARTPTIA